MSEWNERKTEAEGPRSAASEGGGSLGPNPGPWGRRDAGGISAGSRWLSAATPPVPESKCRASRQGCQLCPRSTGPRCGSSTSVGSTGLAPLQGAGDSWVVGFRWCRCPQPPATSLDPSGIGLVWGCPVGAVAHGSVMDRRPGHGRWGTSRWGRTRVRPHPITRRRSRRDAPSCPISPSPGLGAPSSAPPPCRSPRGSGSSTGPF